MGDKAWLEVIDDPVHHGIVGEDSDDARWRKGRNVGPRPWVKSPHPEKTGKAQAQNGESGQGSVSPK